MSAANELLQVIHAALTADSALFALIGADGVRDRLVNGATLPGAYCFGTYTATRRV